MRPPVFVAVVVALDVFVEDTEEVAEAVEEAERETEEQPEGVRLTLGDFVEVVEGVRPLLSDTDTVSVPERDCVEEAEGLFVTEAEAVTVALRVEVLDPVVDVEWVKEGSAVFDTGVVEVAVTVPEADPEGEPEAVTVLLAVDVFEEVCETEGLGLSVEASLCPHAAPPPAVPLTDTVVVLLADPERDTDVVKEGDFVEEGEGVFEGVLKADLLTELEPETESVTVFVRVHFGEAVTESEEVPEKEGEPDPDPVLVPPTDLLGGKLVRVPAFDPELDTEGEPDKEVVTEAALLPVTLLLTPGVLLTDCDPEGDSVADEDLVGLFDAFALLLADVLPVFAADLVVEGVA